MSSTLEELAAERAAVRDAIEGLHLTPVMFELGARPHPPRDLYRAYLSQSDVFVGVYGDSYGWVAPDADLSGLEEELRMSESKPRLLYVRTPAPQRDPRLTALIEGVWASGSTSTTPYRTPEELAQRVADDLAVLLTERFAGPEALPGLRPPALPVPPSALVGRQAELDRVLGLLRRDDIRLVTLVGPGGIGKTRLALEAAGRLTAERDGVWFIDLSALDDPALVAPTVASSLGVRAEGHDAVLDLLLDRLGGVRAVLLLDNFEQVAEAAGDVARLLAGCPRLQVLATSRTVLHLRGEHDVPLAPLATPASDEVEVEEVSQSQAVALLVERARRVRPAFELTAGNAADVAEIARLTEGIPLAVELAAARLRLLSPSALLARLGDRLDLAATDVDTPSRQRTLRATIDWSHDLLGAAERALLARLAVCAGSWSLEAAEALGGDVDTLASLVGHSLVHLDDDRSDEPRFRMLESVRAYAAERLAERGDGSDARAALSRHLVGWSATAGDGLRTADNRRWRGRIDAEVDNLRAALRWGVEDDDAERVVRLAAPLSRYWWMRGMLAEMLDVADATAALPSAAALPSDAEALLLWARGTMRIALGRVSEAPPLLERLVEVARDAGDDLLVGHGLAALAMTRAPGAEVRAMLLDAVALFRRSGDAWSTAFGLIPLGHVELLLGDVEAASRRHHEALDLARQIDDDHLCAQAHDQLGGDAVLSGDADAARSHLASAVELHRATRDQEGMAYCLDGLAALSLLAGDPRLAARLVGAADHARTVAGVSVWPFVQPLLQQLDDAVAAALGADAAAERAEGARLTPLAALDAGLAGVSG